MTKQKTTDRLSQKFKDQTEAVASYSSLRRGVSPPGDTIKYSMTSSCAKPDSKTANVENRLKERAG